VGICGTDREIVSFAYGTPPANSDFLIIGHEALARVQEVGDEVKTLKPGDWVVPMVRRPCDDPNCLACRSGQQDFCNSGRFLERGIKGLHGFMIEESLDTEHYLIPVPENLKDLAVLTEPLTIAEKSVKQILGIQQRLPWACPRSPEGPGCCHRALVFGAGTVGLLGCLLLLVRGFEVAVYSLEARDSFKARWIESLGAKYYSAADIATDKVAQVAGHFDAIYEATGASNVAFHLLPCLGANGIYVLTGVPSLGASHNLDTDLIMRRLVLENQLVFGSVNAGRGDYESAVKDLQEFLRRWPEQLKSLIASRIPLAQAPEALKERLPGIKNTIRVNA
jgi:threonine dehydrogenase-like Zn-dependent dehydrogenase